MQVFSLEKTKPLECSEQKNVQKYFIKYFSFTTKVFSFFQNHPFQTFVVPSTYIFIYVKKDFHKIAMSAISWGVGVSEP